MQQTHNLLIFALLFLFQIGQVVECLKFDIQAHPGQESSKHERCIRNFVSKDQLVMVIVNVSGQRGDGQVLNMHVSLSQSAFQ